MSLTICTNVAAGNYTIRTQEDCDRFNYHHEERPGINYANNIEDCDRFNYHHEERPGINYGYMLAEPDKAPRKGRKLNESS